MMSTKGNQAEPPGTEMAGSDGFNARAISNDGQRKPNSGDVHACYRYILGRNPENDNAVLNHIAHNSTIDNLRFAFLQSREFLRIIDPIVRPSTRSLFVENKFLNIETDADIQQIQRMLTVTRRAWMKLGETMPYWSVLQDDRFRPENFEKNRRIFRETGRDDRDLIERMLKRLGLNAGRFVHIVDFGCGVGRSALHLAAIFPNVTGVDFSAAHLIVARSDAVRLGMPHLRWLRSRPEVPMPADDYDVWFSRRALQYNPPPVIKTLLSIAFAKLRAGGVACFQVPTYCESYSFQYRNYEHESDGSKIEYHVLRQADVFQAAHDAGLELLEINEDRAASQEIGDNWRSDFFVFRKPLRT